MLEKVSRQAVLSQIEIRSSVELPSNRIPLTLRTADGLDLVAELALPVDKAPVATLIMLHPLPTAGGFMDSHIYRKAANRLPALADLAILRFNTRGTTSPHGTSQGSFDGGVSERFDVEAAVAFAVENNLPNIWLVGWSFGTELALKYGPELNVLGAILLSPPLHRTSVEELERWNTVGRVLELIAKSGNPDLAVTFARDWIRIRPEGATPDKELLRSLVPLLTEAKMI